MIYSVYIGVVDIFWISNPENPKILKIPDQILENQKLQCLKVSYLSSFNLNALCAIAQHLRIFVNTVNSN